VSEVIGTCENCETEIVEQDDYIIVSKSPLVIVHAECQ
jgi:hypothetical protein